MTTIDHIIIETDDTAAAERFYAAWGLADRVRVRATDGAPTSGFRGYTMSLVTSQPGNVDELTAAALRHGATELKAPKKSMWGYGAAVQAPDGSVWTIAASSKKDDGPAAASFDEVVLLIGPEDVKASKAFYVDRGLEVAKSYGKKYVEFADDGPIKFALTARPTLAKNAGVPAEGSGSHRLAIVGDLGGFTDPDGFAWEGA